ncbi:MAG: anti-sigma factor family protein [Planctomycetota bacterium]|jgi:hypothetical protein
MKCDDFRSVMQELLDGELDAQRAREAEDHAAECLQCASALSKARRDLERVEDAVRGAVEPLRPNEARRRDFVGRFARSKARRPELAVWAAALAAAFLVALTVTLVVTEGPDPVDEYRAALNQRVEDGLNSLAFTSGDHDIVDPILTAQEWALEDMMVGGRIVPVSLEDAPRDLTSPNMRRRVGARRRLLEAETLPEIPEQFRPFFGNGNGQEGDPKPDGEVVCALQQVNSSGGALLFLKFKQWENGVIRIVAREGSGGKQKDHEIWAHDMRDLTEKHPEFCARFGITGEKGRINVGTTLLSNRTVRKKVRRVIVSGDPEQALEDLAEIRMDAAEGVFVIRMKAVDKAREERRRVEAEIRSVGFEDALQLLRSRVGRENLQGLEGLEKIYRKLRELEILRDRLRGSGK